jgi:alpha-N-arabinofuranosidase
MCALLGCEPLICGNVGSGSPQELAQWLEYVNADRGSLADERRENGRAKPWHVKFWGIGNESWGCGGNMRPEYYADLMDQYATFMKPYGGTQPFCIACGASDFNTGWTDVLMQSYKRKPMFQGLSLHYYTLPTGNWSSKGSATNFGEDQYFSTLHNTLRMEELITKHSAIMDKYDPQKKVGLVVDEWGIWTDVEPGTNPGFLYQQNSLRDALVAATNFHIFHAHADRVTMANIAQMVNVLQAMILTDKDRMLLTPTYHAFEMFKVHQGATALALKLTTPDYVFGDGKIPAVSASASRDAAGRIHISLVNTNPHDAITVASALTGVTAKSVTGRILTAPATNSHNTFNAPHTVEPVAFSGAKLDGSTLTVALPAKSIVVLELQ